MSIAETLLRLEEPYFHLVTATQEDLSQLLEQVANQSVGSKHVTAYMKGSAAKDYDSFFLEIALAFPFPDYFGRNWAALNDCLNDLDWLDADSYLLCIADAEQLLLDHEAHLPTFVKYLKESVKEWVNGRDHDEFPTPPTPFHVVFHCTPEQEQTLRDRLTAANMLIEKTCAL